MITLFLQLLLAHLIGDFAFQPTKWVKHKNEKKAASKYLYLHIAIHALLLFIILQFALKYWVGILAICITHYLIDIGKLYGQVRFKGSYLFVIDQLLHMVVITVVAVLYTQPQFQGIAITNEFLLAACSVVFVTYVAAVLMRLIMNFWKLKEDSPEDSLQQAGKYIGMIERLLIFLFVVLNQWSAIGFLIAAKSILRFSDLSRSKDRKLTEYVIIGTLLSISIAIITGLAYKMTFRYLQTL
ncbi:DUF3307 domain-containing protein [Niabella insulamsoli]|uniref:DUF3307 domain-containing protein n=1 Tax=Niabella insulamsoli TaxID=3144874 RepID=UPI0031FD11AE